MKKTTIILLVLFLILGAGAAWYFMNNTGPKATYKTSNMDFKIDPDLVYKIFLADREGNKTTLVREGNEWLLEGTMKTRPSTIHYLIEAIRGVEVKYRPAKAAYPKITKDLATYGIEVELYGKEGELLRNYYVGGVDENGEGNYMIMAESDEPFATHITSFVGGLRTRFAMTGDQWRDRSVFAEDPNDITSVTIEYPRQRNQSFKLLKEGSAWKVEPFFKTTPIIDADVIKGKPEQFLQGFKSKIAESFQHNDLQAEYAKSNIPFAILSMTKKDGTEKSVRFVPYRILGADGNFKEQKPEDPVFRFHADCSWGDLMIIQQGVFEEVFWGYESFFK